MIANALPRMDYGDAFRREVPCGKWPSAEAAARALFTSGPAWVGGLMAVRDGAVKLFGLKTSRVVSEAELRAMPLEPGREVGIFRVYLNTPAEMVLGQDDRHLNFRVSLRLEREGERATVTLSTVVQFHNAFGRAYFLPVKFFHKRIVCALLSRIGGEGGTV